MYLNTRHTILLSKSFESSPATMVHTHNTRFQANNKHFNAAVASMISPSGSMVHPQPIVDNGVRVYVTRFPTGGVVYVITAEEMPTLRPLSMDDDVDSQDTLPLGD